MAETQVAKKASPRAKRRGTYPESEPLWGFRDRLWLVVPWFVAAGLVGYGLWLVYLFAAMSGGEACAPNAFFGGWAGGGQASYGSNVAAGVIGAAGWLVGGVVYVLLGRRGWLLWLGCAGLNFVGLVALWSVSPVIWGPRHC